MENRLKIIYDAASALFINKGYIRTQVKDIASEIGLSAGMVYVYFKGKREILDFILKCTVDPDFIHREFRYPIDASLFDGLSEEIIAVLSASHERFGAHLPDEAVGYPFQQMLSDAFDIISHYGTGCLILEKNIDDMGKLGDYYQVYRKKFFQHMHDYITLYMGKGEMRTVKHPELTTQLIIETLSWWAMHIRNDAFEIKRQIPLEDAKEVCLDNLIHAYSND